MFITLPFTDMEMDAPPQFIPYEVEIAFELKSITSELSTTGIS